jgi:uncharacterized protein with HEPN domain
MAGLRDKLIHDYFGIDLEIIWGVLEFDLPKLYDDVSAILAEQGEAQS